MKKELQLKLLKQMPNYAGLVARDVYNCQMYKQPLLAIQSGLSMAALMRGQRYQGHNGCKTNLFSLGVGGTSTGKGTGITYIRKLTALCGLTSLTCHKPGSKIGFTTALDQGCCTTLMAWDEIGKTFEAMLDYRGDPNLKQIGEEVLQLFSDSLSFYSPPLIADSKTGRKNYIFHQPVIIINGVTTPVTLFKSITSDNISDGLLPRFLYFRALEDQEKDSMCAVRISPQVMAATEERIKYLWMCRNNPKQEIRGRIEVGSPSPESDAMFDNEAMELFEKCRGFERATNKVERDIRSRAMEHVAKVSLTVAEDGSHWIKKNEVLWAAMLVEFTLQDLVEDIMCYVADTPFEKNCNKVMRFLNTSSPCPEDKLFAAFPMKERELTEILNSLLKANRIEIVSGQMYNTLETGQLWDMRKEFKQQPFRG